jgi:apolipoprotein N-acyltransferase
MTDFTTDTPLARGRTAPPKREYYAYFAIIFLATLPLSFLTWGLSAARKRAAGQGLVTGPYYYAAHLPWLMCSSRHSSSLGMMDQGRG